jgi:hypothetical protein
MLCDDKRWANIQRIYQRASPFGNETGSLPNGEYFRGKQLFKNLRENSKVLVVGAGGLGCEILKVIKFKYSNF